MKQALETKISELAVWKASSVSLECTEHFHQPAATVRGTTAVVLHSPGRGLVPNYSHEGNMEREPEFQAAWTKVQEAIKGLHEAREAIIQRKAVELATLIHGDKLNGIRALVDQIQGGAES